MDYFLNNSYLLVYTGTLLLGAVMFAIVMVCFVAVTSVLAVAYGLVNGARGIFDVAVKSRPVVVPEPTVMRHSSRTVVVLPARKAAVEPAAEPEAEPEVEPEAAAQGKAA